MIFDLQWQITKISDHIEGGHNGNLSLAESGLTAIKNELSRLGNGLENSHTSDGKIEYKFQGVEYEINITERILTNLEKLIHSGYQNSKLDAEIQIRQLTAQFDEITQYLD